MPLVGRAIFAQRPAEDIQRQRLVYAPLNASNYYETSATLGQYIVFKYNSDAFEELNRLVDTVVGPNATRQDKEAVQTFLQGLAPPLPARFNEQIETLGNRGERDYTSLIFDLQFIGVMVTDNLTPADRKWWAQNGIIRSQPACRALPRWPCRPARPRSYDLVAYEVFSPLEPAYWDCARNELVKVAREAARPASRFQRIGTIVSVGVVEVNLFTRHYKARRSLVVDVSTKRGRQRRKLHGNPPRDHQLLAIGHCDLSGGWIPTVGALGVWHTEKMPPDDTSACAERSTRRSRCRATPR